MQYELKKAEEKDISRIIDYSLQTILEYSETLSKDEINRVQSYVKENVSRQLENYKIIYSKNNKIMGCLLVKNKDDGVLLEELYLEKQYRNKKIGTNIIKGIISKNDRIYLWVYKLNVKAISLYIKLGFKIIEKTETRYYMKYNKQSNH